MSKLIAVVLLSGFLVFFRAPFFLDTICNNTSLVAVEKENTAPFTACSTRNQSNNLLIWREGYLKWERGQQQLAMQTWENAADYTALALLNQVSLAENKGVPQYDLLVAALNLQPMNRDIAGPVTKLMLDSQVWSQNDEHFQALMTQYPTAPEIMAAQAITSLQIDPDSSDSRMLMENALQIAPKNPYVISYALRYLLGVGEFDTGFARRVADLGLDLEQNDFELTFRLATVFAQRGEWETAVSLNQKALSIDPQHPIANLQQAELAQKIGQDAAPFVDIAWRLRSENPSYFQRLIAVLVTANRVEEAKAAFCEGISYDYPVNMLTKRLAAADKLLLDPIKCES